MNIHPLHRHRLHLHIGVCLMAIVTLLSLNLSYTTKQSFASTFIQTATGTKKSSEATPTSVSATFASTATAGRLLIAVLGAGGNTTITAPSGFSTAINQSGTVSQGIFYKTAAGGESTITATVSSNPSSIGLHIYEYSGSFNTLNQTNSSTGNNGNPTTGSITTTVNNELLFGAFTDDINTNHNDGTWSDVEGFTERNDFKTTGSGTSNTFAGGDNLTNTAGSHTLTTSIGSTANWRGQIVSFNNGPVPTVTNITSSTTNGTYGVGQSVSVQVTFSESVTVTGTPQLTLETGTSDAVVNYTSGSGTNTLTFNYTIASGHTSSDLDYVSTTSLALNGGTIRDTDTNDATLTLFSPGAAGSLGANKALVIDGVVPTVTNVTSSTADGSYTTGQSISIQVTFSEAVTVTGTPQLLLETGASDAVVNYTSGSGTNTLTFDYTVASGHTSSDLDYVSTSALTLNSGTIRDAASNNATLTLAAPSAAGSLGANKNIIIDTTAPTVTNVTSNTANGTYGPSSVIDIRVVFSEPVIVTNTPTITLETGLSDAVVSYTSGSGTNTLIFNYTVQIGHLSLDLDYISTAALALSGGTIKDAATNNATLTLASPGAAGSLGANKNIIIASDITPPTIAEVTPVPTPTNDTTPNYTFSSTEAGTITYGGDCSSATTSAVAGNNTVTFNTLSAGLHNNCTITVTDGASNVSNVLNVTAFTIDTTAPTIAQVVAVPSPTGDNTPNYTFSSTEAGTITYGGDCSSATTSAVVGNNTVTFNTLADGSHSNCTITVTDAAGNVSNLLNVNTFIVDTAAPVIAQVTPVPSPTNDTTPNYTFSSTEAGTITYGGDCSSATTSAVVGNNTVTFNALSPGTHSNCTITVTDAQSNVSNVLNVNTFIIDTTAPTVTEVTPVPSPTGDNTPNYTFNTTEAGTITYGGDCSSATTTAVSGNNTVTFNTLPDGLHNNCTITITDAAGNVSNVLNISPFTVDTDAPVIAEVTPVPTPTNDTTPNYTFSSTEAGTITYGGDCSSATTSAVAGNNTITFNALTPGFHNNCTITVTDAQSNVSNILNVSPFTIDTTAPTVTEVTPVPSPTGDNTPNYTFNTTEGGTITYGGDCSSATTSAVSGNNTITFNTLADGTHTNCTIRVTDAAGNLSNILNVSSFTVDTAAPIIAEVTPVTTPTNDTTPNYTFSSTEAGTITYGGDCSSATTSAVVGNNTITFNALTPGLHNNCTISVTDAQSNVSNVLNVSPFTIDTTAPTVTNITSLTANGTYGPATVIDVRVTFSESVTVTGTPQITLETGTSDAVVSYTSGSGTNTLLFNYTVAIGHSSLDLDYISSSALALNSGTIRDAATNNATLTLPNPGAAGSLGFNKNIVIATDVTPPTIAEVTPVPTPANDTTPNYTFSSTESGTITYGGDCSSATTSAFAGNNTITFNALTPGLHNNCTITVTDAASNVSNILNVSPFTIDTSAPTIAQVTAVPSPTNDTTPNYTFSSTEAGTITYGGDCSSATTSAAVGNNTVTFNALSVGTHSNCTIQVTDSSSNVSNLLNVNTFIIDTTAPTVTEVTPVPSPTSDNTPNYTFNTTEAGTITYGGDCSSITTSAVSGNNTVTFNTLADGTHSNCTIRVTDAAGNLSNILNVSSFTVDTAAPFIAQVTAVPSPTNDTTPNYTFSSTEAGTITYGGDCSSVTTAAIVGNNTVTFNTLAPGTHSNCTIQVTDAQSNVSNVLNVSPFTIDTTAPIVTEVTPVSSPTGDNTPNYTFNTTEAGTITYGGDCSSATTSAAVGNNTVTFNALSAGTHSNCTIRVTDAAGNLSNLLNVNTFIIDNSAPVIAQVTAVPSPTNDTTPNYTFSSTEAGTITYGGDCSSATTSAVSGNNTVTFNALSVGTHSNCTIQVTDSSSNVSNLLNVNTFIIDTTAPTVTEVTPVPDPTTDPTPNYTFNTTEGGTITYGGDCSSATTTATPGNNTITFNTLSPGTHSNCTITITDPAGNISNTLNITPFTVNTVDTTPPTIAEVIAVPDPTNDTTPNYTFSSTEAGTITYVGDCSSATTSAVSGNNTVTFNTLSLGTHSNCTITVTDAASNVSNVLNVSPFTVDTSTVGDQAAPTLIEVIPVPTPDNDPTPEYTFNTTEGGTITYGGGCTSDTTVAEPGDNTITFGPLEPGVYDNCFVIVTDAFGNQSEPLQISPFTIENSNNASARNNRHRDRSPTAVGCGRTGMIPPFVDIQGSETFAFITNFYQRCIVDGRTGTMFMPDSSVTKAEFVKIVMNTYNLGTAAYEPAFADVGPDHPLAPYIIQAAKMGFIYGYNPEALSYFSPNVPITRAEAFKILLLAKNAQLGGYGENFSDVKPGDWFYDFAAWAENKGLANGYHQVFSHDGLVKDFFRFAEKLYVRGDIHEDIGNYKEAFAQLGYFYGDFNDTFDPELIAGVSAYQTIKGIKPNIGQIGAQTRISLLNERLVPHEENWFRPNRPITRSEVVKIVYLSEGLQ